MCKILENSCLFRKKNLLYFNNIVLEIKNFLITYKKNYYESPFRYGLIYYCTELLVR
jgi:hypothetical protein